MEAFEKQTGKKGRKAKLILSSQTDDYVANRL
jgi:hypothetical protein